MAFTVIRIAEGGEEKIHLVSADTFEVLRGGVLKTYDHERRKTTYHSPTGWLRVETRDDHPHGTTKKGR